MHYSGQYWIISRAWTISAMRNKAHAPNCTTNVCPHSILYKTCFSFVFWWIEHFLKLGHRISSKSKNNINELNKPYVSNSYNKSITSSIMLSPTDVDIENKANWSSNALAAIKHPLQRKRFKILKNKNFNWNIRCGKDKLGYQRKSWNFFIKSSY